MKRRLPSRKAKQAVPRAPAARRGRRAPDAADESDDDVGGLTKAQVREIERIRRDLDDPIRYLLVSDFGARFKLYYDASDGVYVMNNPAHATLFKRREAALAVRATLGDRIKIIRCKTKLKGGKRVPALKQPKASRRSGGRHGAA